MYRVGEFNIDMFMEGSKQMRPQSFKAGLPIYYILEFDWARDSITRDWSITVWAEDGNINVKHNSGI